MPTGLFFPHQRYRGYTSLRRELTVLCRHSDESSCPLTDFCFSQLTTLTLTQLQHLNGRRSKMIPQAEFGVFGFSNFLKRVVMPGVLWINRSGESSRVVVSVQGVL